MDKLHYILHFQEVSHDVIQLFYSIENVTIISEISYSGHKSMVNVLVKSGANLDDLATGLAESIGKSIKEIMPLL